MYIYICIYIYIPKDETCLFSTSQKYIKSLHQLHNLIKLLFILINFIKNYFY